MSIQYIQYTVHGCRGRAPPYCLLVSTVYCLLSACALRAFLLRRSLLALACLLVLIEAPGGRAEILVVASPFFCGVLPPARAAEGGDPCCLLLPAAEAERREHATRNTKKQQAGRTKRVAGLKRHAAARARSGERRSERRATGVLLRSKQLRSSLLFFNEAGQPKKFYPSHHMVAGATSPPLLKEW